MIDSRHTVVRSRVTVGHHDSWRVQRQQSGVGPTDRNSGSPSQQACCRATIRFAEADTSPGAAPEREAASVVLAVRVRPGVHLEQNWVRIVCATLAWSATAALVDGHDLDERRMILEIYRRRQCGRLSRLGVRRVHWVFGKVDDPLLGLEHELRQARFVVHHLRLAGRRFGGYWGKPETRL